MTDLSRMDIHVRHTGAAEKFLGGKRTLEK